MLKPTLNALSLTPMPPGAPEDTPTMQQIGVMKRACAMPILPGRPRATKKRASPPETQLIVCRTIMVIQRGFVSDMLAGSGMRSLEDKTVAYFAAMIRAAMAAGIATRRAGG